MFKLLYLILTLTIVSPHTVFAAEDGGGPPPPPDFDADAFLAANTPTTIITGAPSKKAGDASSKKSVDPDEMKAAIARRRAALDAGSTGTSGSSISGSSSSSSGSAATSAKKTTTIVNDLATLNNNLTDLTDKIKMDIKGQYFPNEKAQAAIIDNTPAAFKAKILNAIGVVTSKLNGAISPNDSKIRKDLLDIIANLSTQAPPANDDLRNAYFFLTICKILEINPLLINNVIPLITKFKLDDSIGYRLAERTYRYIIANVKKQKLDLKKLKSIPAGLCYDIELALGYPIEIMPMLEAARTDVKLGIIHADPTMSKTQDDFVSAIDKLHKELLTLLKANITIGKYAGQKTFAAVTQSCDKLKSLNIDTYEEMITTKVRGFCSVDPSSGVYFSFVDDLIEVRKLIEKYNNDIDRIATIASFIPQSALFSIFNKLHTLAECVQASTYASAGVRKTNKQLCATCINFDLNGTVQGTTSLSEIQKEFPNPMQPDGTVDKNIEDKNIENVDAIIKSIADFLAVKKPNVNEQQIKTAQTDLGIIQARKAQERTRAARIKNWSYRGNHYSDETLDNWKD